MKINRIIAYMLIVIAFAMSDIGIVSSNWWKFIPPLIVTPFILTERVANMVIGYKSKRVVWIARLIFLVVFLGIISLVYLFPEIDFIKMMGW